MRCHVSVSASPLVTGFLAGTLFVAISSTTHGAPAATEPAPSPAEAENPQATPVDAPPAEQTPDSAVEQSADPAEASQQGPTVDAGELSRVQAQADALRDEILKARTRVSLIASKLFTSKVVLDVRSNLERFYEVSDLVITVDGAPAYLRESGLPPTAGPVFELFAAPGSHELGISAQLVARRERSYRVRIAQTFVITVPQQATVRARLTARETGNMWRFGKSQRGHYRTVMTLKARAKKNKGTATKSSGAAPAKPSQAPPAKGKK